MFSGSSAKCWSKKYCMSIPSGVLSLASLSVFSSSLIKGVDVCGIQDDASKSCVTWAKVPVLLSSCCGGWSSIASMRVR